MSAIQRQGLYPKTKHEKLKLILKEMGIDIVDNYFSRGSTITSDALDAIINRIDEFTHFYHFVTKPIPQEIKSVFIKYLRGFEEFYRMITGNEIIVKTDPLPNNCIGVMFQSTVDGIMENVEIDIFSQFLEFTQTNDFSKIENFNLLSPEKQLLLKNNYELQKNFLINEQLVKQITEQKSSSVLNIQIEKFTQINQLDYIDNTRIVINHIYIKLESGLNDNDIEKIKSALKEIVDNEKKTPGFFEGFKKYCKDTTKRITLKYLKEWLSNPDNVTLLSEELRDLLLSII